jgi:hypothetical protein
MLERNRNAPRGWAWLVFVPFVAWALWSLS